VTGEATYALAQCQFDADTTSCSTCIDEGLRCALVNCSLQKEALVGYDLCTIQLSGTAISSSPQLNVSVSKVDNMTVQSMTLEMGIEALTSGVASLAANSSQRFATVVVEMDADGCSGDGRRRQALHRLRT
jgi:hypothetical protein